MEEIIGPSAPDLIKDTTTENFIADVIEASREAPVIVDLWAPWCGPCKQLGPALEKVVKSANGAVKLVKLNIDENPEVAQQLRVQSIPAVFAFKDGQPVDGFVGALPESQIKQFVERLAGGIGPSPVDQALEQAKAAQEKGDNAAAKEIYSLILKHEPDNIAGLAGLLRCHIALDEHDRARALLGTLDETTSQVPEIASASAALKLAEDAESASTDTAELEARLSENPDNHETRFELAMAHFAAGRREEAVDALLEIVRRDRKWNEEAARTQLVQFFDAFGPDDPLTLSGRRRLSSVLFA
jgi:putative thioredoxin